MLNSFVVVAVEADTVVAVIVSGVLTVEAVTDMGPAQGRGPRGRSIG